jgi:hypothetical protein
MAAIPVRDEPRQIRTANPERVRYFAPVNLSYAEWVPIQYQTFIEASTTSIARYCIVGATETLPG